MTFAAKIGKDETIKLSTQSQTILTITNIALAPKATVIYVKFRKPAYTSDKNRAAI